jgi:hypothetical protein
MSATILYISAFGPTASIGRIMSQLEMEEAVRPPLGTLIDRPPTRHTLRPRDGCPYFAHSSSKIFGGRYMCTDMCIFLGALNQAKAPRTLVIRCSQSLRALGVAVSAYSRLKSARTFLVFLSSLRLALDAVTEHRKPPAPRSHGPIAYIRLSSHTYRLRPL